MFNLEPGKNCEEFAYVGSRVTCNPAPTDTDRDILVLCVEGEKGELCDMIARAGGEVCGNVDYGDDMIPMRLGEDNFLVTEDEDYYEKFLAVTAVARGLNIMDKNSRHAMFKALLDDDFKLVGGRVDRVLRKLEAPF